MFQNKVTQKDVKQEAGAQPKLFQGRGGFLESGHFDKYFAKKHKKKKAPQGKFGSFSLLDTLKTIP